MKYKKTNDVFLSTDKKTLIKYDLYIPEEKVPKAILQLLPDMGESAEHYECFCNIMTSHGIIVCICDCLGNIDISPATASEYPQDGDIGIITEDILIFRSVVRKKYRTLPCVILGHGTGALAARVFTVKHPTETDGIILSNIFYGYSSFSMLICKIIAFVLGRQHRSNFLQRTLFGKYKFPKTFTCNEYISFFSMLKETSSEEWAALYPKSVPMLIINAQESQSDHGISDAQIVCNALVDAEFEPLSLKNYYGYRRDIFNEDDLKLSAVCDDIVLWVNQIISDVIELRNSSSVVFSSLRK